MDYDQGKGVKQDYAEAAKWYFMAADQGNANSMNDLANLYDKDGFSVRRNQVFAYALYDLAVTNGDSQIALTNRDHLGAKLSKVDIAKAKRLELEISHAKSVSAVILIQSTRVTPHQQ